MRDPNKVKRYAANWTARNPEKRAAQILLNSAVAAGKVTRQPCEVCGSTYRVHGHHEDYSKPLEVHWLCPTHHKQAHGIFKVKGKEPWDHTKKVQLRDKALVLRSDGMSYSQIGQALGMSMGHAYKIINQPPYR
jgi:hypothetical protein